VFLPGGGGGGDTVYESEVEKETTQTRKHFCLKQKLCFGFLLGFFFERTFSLSFVFVVKILKGKKPGGKRRRGEVQSFWYENRKSRRRV